MASSYPDCFRYNEYGVSGSFDACPECGSEDYRKSDSEGGLVDLRCNSCGQNYSVSESFVSSS